jgi:hypothetical protein
MYDDIRICLEVEHFPIGKRRLLPDESEGPYGRVKLTSPTDHSLRVRSVRKATRLVIEGSFMAFLQGHNVVGTMNLMALVKKVVGEILKRLEIKPSHREQRRIDEGRIKLERLDVVGFVKVDDLGGPAAVLRALDVGLAGSRANRMIFARETVVYHSHSRYWSLMGYDKAAHLQAVYPETWAALDEPTQGIASNYLRLELRQFRRELVRQGWDQVRDVEVEQVKKVFVGRFKRLTEDMRRPYPRLLPASDRPSTALLMGLLASFGVDLISNLSPRRQRAVRAELRNQHGIHVRSSEPLPRQYRATAALLLDRRRLPVRHGAPRTLRQKGWLATFSKTGRHDG